MFRTTTFVSLLALAACVPFPHRANLTPNVKGRIQNAPNVRVRVALGSENDACGGSHGQPAHRYFVWNLCVGGAEGWRSVHESRGYTIVDTGPWWISSLTCETPGGPYEVKCREERLTGAVKPYDSAGVDHILLGAASLDEGIRAFESATGVSPVRGGKHPNRGTENALVSLGRGVYLEIIAPQPDAQPNEMVTQLRALRAPALIAWAVHVTDAADAAARLGRAGFPTTAPQPGSRVTPQGATLSWVAFQLEKRVGSAPFFIRWGDSTTHPSITSPGGCTLTSFRVSDPQGDELSRLLAAVGVAADVRSAERAEMRLTLRCGGREAAFDSP